MFKIYQINRATVANRNNGTGCPICSKESKTSFPEQTIFYYLSKVFKAENRFLCDDKIEIDIYLPDYKIGIEYDGYYYHKVKWYRYIKGRRML